MDGNKTDFHRKMFMYFRRLLDLYAMQQLIQYDQMEHVGTKEKHFIIGFMQPRNRGSSVTESWTCGGVHWYLVRPDVRKQYPFSVLFMLEVVFITN